MRLLAQAGRSLTDVDVFAVATGPGSFTGLRVGIATMQGLAFAAGKPLIGVSAFDALAGLAGRPDGAGRVATWVEAWRGDVYAALYEGGIEIEPATVEHPQQLLARYTHPTLFIGDGADIHREAIVAALGDAARIAEAAAPLLAGTMAVMASESARAGHRPPPHAIRPLYVRRPGPEPARDARPVR
jgi:tRNA threonylcarbamoyladenosine biosynthesis protein TsaB